MIFFLLVKNCVGIDPNNKNKDSTYRNWVNEGNKFQVSIDQIFEIVKFAKTKG